MCGMGTDWTDLPPGTSPFVAACRRVLQNRLATIGPVLVVVMILLVLFAPWVTPHDPTELLPWLGAKPPGFTHPDCLLENAFRVGRPAESSPRVRDATVLTIVRREMRAETFRVTVRRDRIHSILRLRGAESLECLDLASLAGEKRELLADGSLGRAIPEVLLRCGEEPPSGLLPAGARVLIFQVSESAPDVTYRIALAAGTVRRIAADGQARDAVRIPGAQVRRVDADGRELTRTHWLGTDELGRDLASRILYGGRISLLVGVVATLVSLLIGVAYGAVSGYAGGRTDRVLMSIVDILYAVPFMFVVIILLVLFGRNLLILFVALGAVQWLTMARIVRGQVLSLKEREFVEAARVAGAGPFTIIVRHLLPQTLGPIIVYTTLTVPAVILQESFLSFIGLSVQYGGRNLESWGSLVDYGVQALGRDGSTSWLLVWPSIAMVLTLFGLNAFGDGLRDAFDPRAERKR